MRAVFYQEQIILVMRAVFYQEQIILVVRALFYQEQIILVVRAVFYQEQLAQITHGSHVSIQINLPSAPIELCSLLLSIDLIRQIWLQKKLLCRVFPIDIHFLLNLSSYLNIFLE